MFYAHIVLAKKGPLARIWLAAHWDKKITKAHVFETNIEQSVEGIMQPKVKLALRTSGHLLLGVVRIYSRKAKYLLADCNEAFVKIKMAFRPGMVDLPEENREAAVNAITLPEVFHDFDTALPELNDVDIEEQFSINQSRADEITMREDYGTLPMSIHEDGFGDMGFDADTPDLARDDLDPNIDESLFAEELADEIQHVSKEPIPGTSRSIIDTIEAHHMSDDGFGDEFGQPAAGLFEGDIFADAPLATPALPPGAMTSRTESDDDMGHYDGGAPSPPSSTYSSRPNTPLPGASVHMPDRVPSQMDNPMTVLPPASPADRMDIEHEHVPVLPENLEENVPEQSGLVLNTEEESFALAPVDATALKGITKSKRKRKLIVDEVKNISGEEMKSQLANTSDIVTTLDLAPPTKRLMYWKETGGVEKLFALPSRDIPARALAQNYQRHLTSRAFGIEDFSVLGPADVLALEQNKPEEQDNLKRGRKRRLNQEQVQLEPSFAEPELAREYEHPPEHSLDIREQTLPESESMPPPPPINESVISATSIINPNLQSTSINQMSETPGMVQMPSPPSMFNYGLPMTPGMPPMSPMPHMTPGISQIAPGMTPGPIIPGIQQPMTPGPIIPGIQQPMTPGMQQPMTPGMQQPMTPDMQQPLTPGVQQPITPGMQQPMTPGIEHPMTPGTSHIPPDMSHMTQQLGSITPMHLGSMTPMHGDDRLPTSGLLHEGMGRVDLHNHHAAMTPGGLDHGGMTPHHTIENMESIPNLPADQVSSILNGTGMENISYTNMGFDGHTPPRNPITTDWNEDYDFPQSVGHQGEEQQENETDEQFEERVLNKRAAQMFITVKQKLQKREHIYLSEMTHRNQKKQAAQKFYSLLVLKKFQAVQITQEKPYADILVTRGLMFDNPTL